MRVSLERQSGIPIAFDPIFYAIEALDGVSIEKETERRAAEMMSYIAEPDARPTSDPIYRVYRNVRKPEHQSTIETSGLRYDLTVIPEGVFQGVRREFFRTAGHYHGKDPAGTPYPEVYEVISGRAYWLIQRFAATAAELTDIYAVEAGAGEKAVIPPGFGHITVNPFDEPLILANWINKSVLYDYRPFEELRGAGYRMFEAEGMIEFERNPNYRSVPDIKKLRPKELPEFGLIRGKPLYRAADDMGKLSLLTTPEASRAELNIEHCFRPL